MIEGMFFYMGWKITEYVLEVAVGSLMYGLSLLFKKAPEVGFHK
jgi:hypothetical protein